MVSSTTGENMNISECTVVLLGDSGVGKTALVNRFVFNTFRQVLFLVFFVSMISFKETGSRDRMESFVDMQRYSTVDQGLQKGHGRFLTLFRFPCSGKKIFVYISSR